MAINDDKIVPSAGIAANSITKNLGITQSMTNQPRILKQMRSGFAIEQVGVYVRTYTATLAIDVGIVPVGGTLGGVTLVVGGTTTKFKINAAIFGISSVIDSNTGLPTVVQKAITDNNAFSSAFTINKAGTTGSFWGAVRIQMDYLGAITTKVVAANQAFLAEADAKANAPAADAGHIDCGTISIETGSGLTFTAGADALAVAGNVAAVNFNGIADAFVSAMTGTIAPVAATLVQGTMAAFATRSYGVKGAFLCARYTSDSSAVVTDAELDVSYRPFPLNGEVIKNPLGA